MILILTERAEDVSVVRMRHVLQAQGAECLVVAPTTMEGRSSLFVANDPVRGGRSTVRLDDRVLDLHDVHAAWLWRGWRPHPLHPRFQQLAAQRQAWQFFENEWVAFHKGFSLALAYNGVFCVNPPPFGLAFEEKCCQLWLAAESGLLIPPTLYTTRLPLVREFYDAHDEQIIYKPFRAHYQVLEELPDNTIRTAKLLTNRVRAEDLIEGENLIPTPGIFQPYIAKHFELRIVVIGKQLFACAIHSQQSARAREDWRRYDFDHTPHEIYELPADVAANILRFMERLGLVFGSIDMIVTPDGEHVFLEVNPNGQFDWIARLTGMPLYEHVAAMLVAGTADYAADAVREVPYAT